MILDGAVHGVAVDDGAVLQGAFARRSILWVLLVFQVLPKSKPERSPDGARPPANRATIPASNHDYAELLVQGWFLGLGCQIFRLPNRHGEGK